MRREIELLRTNPALRRLWLAGVVSQAGDWMSYVAVSLLALDRGTGAVDVALVLVLHVLPKALLSPVSGVLADRIDRRRLLIAAACAAAVITAGMAWAAALGSLFAVQVLLVMRTSVEALAEPARTAAVGQLVERDELIAANSALAASWSVMFTLGMGLGGLLASFGVEIAMVVDVLTFVAAAGLLLGLPRLPAAITPAGADHAAIARSLAQGWRASGRHRGLRRAVMAKAPLALAGGAAWIVMNVEATLHTGIASAAVALGLMHSVRGIGTGIGPLLASHWVGTGRRLAPMWWGLNVASLFGMLLFLGSGSLALVVVSMLIWGAGTGGNWVVAHTRLQALAPSEVIGRVAALDELLSVSAMSVGALAIGLAIDCGMASTWPTVGVIALGFIAWIAVAPPLWPTDSPRVRPVS